MLRNSDLGKKISSNLKMDLTFDDIAKLYRIITIDSCDKSSVFSDILTLVRKKLLDFVSTELMSSSFDKQLSQVERKILNSQLDILAHKNYFEGKFDLQQLAAIKQYILAKGEIRKETLAKEHPQNSNDCYRFLSTIFEAMANNYLRQGKIEDAVSNYYFALSELSKIPHVTFNAQDEELKSRYQRHLSFALKKQADIYFQQKNFDQAVNQYKKALLVLKEIHPTRIDKDDIHARNLCQNALEIAQTKKQNISLIQSSTHFKRKMLTQPSEQLTKRRRICSPQM